jgi:hypothetical protein
MSGDAIFTILIALAGYWLGYMSCAFESVMGWNRVPDNASTKDTPSKPRR